MIFALLSTDPKIPAQPQPTVPNTYVPLGNDSIKAVTQNMTWDDARRHCEGGKASLASLRNELTQAYVELLAINLRAPLWIGLKKQVQGCNHLKLLHGSMKTLRSSKNARFKEIFK